MTEPVAISGTAALTAFGHGVDPLLDAAWAGRPAFRPVDRFSVLGRRVGVAATLPGLAADRLLAELATAVVDACTAAGLTAAERAATPLLLAVHSDPDSGRDPSGDRSAAGFARRVAVAAGTAAPLRTYTSACVAASTAVADAAALLNHGPAERFIVAAGYLVEPDQFALFDAGRALALDGQVRPFSADRRGLLLGDGVAAVVVEAGAALRRRAAEPRAWLHGWARTGDAYHVCQPRPDGAGLARAIDAALARARLNPEDIGYVNAHGSGSPQSDVAEAAALHRALGPLAEKIPVSSTKSVHGQALEASGLVELVLTVGALAHGRLPVNAGYLGPDDDCRLDVIVTGARETRPRYALSLNAAFGGANTALLVGAA